MRKKTIQCTLCPKACKLLENEYGDCNARQRINDKIELLTMDKPCSIAIDPMEKKPLYHFYPGEQILSLGMAGCTLHCKNCQNSSISQVRADSINSQYLPIENLIQLLEKYNLRHVAYTYTEPLVAYEYVKKCAEIVREYGGKNVLVTAGYINVKPLKELLPFIDGINLDIKGIDDKFYQENCGIELAPVLRNAEIIKEMNVHLEVTNLVIPTMNDTDSHFELLSQFVTEKLGKETVLHFSAFFPTYQRKNLQATPVETLQRAETIAKSYGLQNVYKGNVSVNSLTHCPECNNLLIERERYIIKSNTIKNGKCPHCQSEIYGEYNND